MDKITEEQVKMFKEVANSTIYNKELKVSCVDLFNDLLKRMKPILTEEGYAKLVHVICCGTIAENSITNIYLAPNVGSCIESWNKGDRFSEIIVNLKIVNNIDIEKFRFESYGCSKTA